MAWRIGNGNRMHPYHITKTCRSRRNPVLSSQQSAVSRQQSPQSSYTKDVNFTNSKRQCVTLPQIRGVARDAFTRLHENSITQRICQVLTRGAPTALVALMMLVVVVVGGGVAAAKCHWIDATHFGISFSYLTDCIDDPNWMTGARLIVWLLITISIDICLWHVAHILTHKHTLNSDLDMYVYACMYTNSFKTLYVVAFMGLLLPTYKFKCWLLRVSSKICPK